MATNRARRRKTGHGNKAGHASKTGRRGVRTPADVAELITLAARFTVASRRAGVPRIAELNRLSAGATSPRLDPATLLVDEVLACLGAAWEQGWQPVELVHAARRRTSAAGSTWLARAVTLEATRSSALDRAPHEWADQLRALADRHGAADDLLPTGGRADVDTWVAALTVLDLMHRLPGSHLLLPPPSRWDHVRQAPSSPISAARHAQQSKTLTKIRALLAKAESTEFAAEAEAFTAKAQDLMTRHSIDEALVAEAAGESVEIAGRKVPIHHPYGLEKASLIDVIARANRVRAVWNEFASCVTIVGVPADVSQVEMLFTSTLVQATRAMTQVGAQADARSRSSAFRKAFLSAYAVRIGTRLSASADHATQSYGTGLVPVLARQTAAVEAEFDRLFPDVTTGARRTRFDARGWDAGTQAADEAVLPAAEVGH
jgi:hypothetical protein